jgi:hypothetical protein
MQSFIVSLIFISPEIVMDNLALRWIIPHGQTLETAVSRQPRVKQGSRPKAKADSHNPSMLITIVCSRGGPLSHTERVESHSQFVLSSLFEALVAKRGT